jgi:DNA-binding GntR family transcriptional regulator
VTAQLVSLQSAPDLVERVYRALVDAISEGSLSRRQLTQEEIAEQLAVSRQPVLQALRLLKKDGLVHDAPGRGVVVAPLDAAASPRSTKSRRARRASPLASPPQRRACSTRRWSRPAGARRGKDIQAMIDADIAFHNAIYDASGNPLIGDGARALWVSCAG